MTPLDWVTKKYPKAHERRKSAHDPEVLPRRIAFAKASLLNFLLLQILFLCLFAYIFGAIYKQASHTHNLNILFVDADGGSIGSAVRQAYSRFEGDAFPTLMERPPSDFPDAIPRLKTEVCKARYWGALYIAPGSTSRLQDALRGGAAATGYNKSTSLYYVWNEARYSAVVDSAISGNLQTLSFAATSIWPKLPNTTQSLSAQDPTALSVLASPWTLTSVNLRVTTQGARLIYNTLVIILILIQEFFYLGTINGLSAQFKLFSTLRPRRIIAYRLLISAVYTMIGSLCVTGMIWAYRSGWRVNGGQFILTWLSLWLFAHCNFLVLDISTVWFPAPYVPMALITWVVFNVSAVLVPFELSPGFFRWAYAVPAHEVYQIITDVWSGGCNPQLRYALPILFSWEVLGIMLTSLGVYRRCHYAVVAEEKAEMAFQDRLNAAMAFERKRDKERRDAEVRRGAEPESAEEIKEEEEVEEEELGQVIRAEDKKLGVDSPRPDWDARVPLSFQLAFGCESSGRPSALTRWATAPAKRSPA